MANSVSASSATPKTTKKSTTTTRAKKTTAKEETKTKKTTSKTTAKKEETKAKTTKAKTTKKSISDTSKDKMIIDKKREEGKITLNEMIANISSGIGKEICFNDFKQYVSEILGITDISNKVFIFKIKPTTAEVINNIRQIMQSIAPFLEKENSISIAIPDINEVDIEVGELDNVIESLQKLRDNISKK